MTHRLCVFMSKFDMKVAARQHASWDDYVVRAAVSHTKAKFLTRFDTRWYRHLHGHARVLRRRGRLSRVLHLYALTR